MAVTSDQAGPYTSPKVVIDVIARHRDRGLPQPVDAATLARAGVSESLIPRTLQSLMALDLIDENGQITPVFEAIRLAPEAEFRARVREWLDAAYADVLQFADPATDDETKVRDAFRNFRPVGQQDRMVTLFLRLYEFAGVELPQSSKVTPRSRPILVRDTVRARDAVKAAPAPRNTPQQRTLNPGLPPAITGLLESLPTQGEGWTKDRRDGFLSTFGAVLDFCYPIVSAPVATVAADDGDEQDE